MRFLKFNGRSLTLISILLMAAFIGTSVMGAASVQAATTPVAPVGDGTSVSVAYTIYKDASGYTCAKSSATGSIDFRDTNSKWVIQKAIDKLSGGYILINAGTYDIPQTIYTNKVSIIGQGNSTILKATTGCSRGHHSGLQRLLDPGQPVHVEPAQRNNHRQPGSRREPRGADQRHCMEGVGFPERHQQPDGPALCA